MYIDEIYTSQSKYRYFRDEIISILQAFEKTKDWADLIKTLQRLVKSIKKYSSIPVLPEKFIICKRLAQCLNKELPSGVHLKTIETYIEIFEHIKSIRLAKDLSIYSTGLFVLFPNASVQIKPKILHVFEQYYLPLKRALIPSLNGMVVSLLSGLEEEGSEVYQQVIIFVIKLIQNRLLIYYKN